MGILASSGQSGLIANIGASRSAALGNYVGDFGFFRDLKLKVLGFRF